jgi:hypothetical protein
MVGVAAPRRSAPQSSSAWPSCRQRRQTSARAPQIMWEDDAVSATDTPSDARLT